MKINKANNKILLVIFALVVFACSSQSQLDESYLSVESNINGAKVYLDSNLIGETPLHNLNVIPGEYNLKVVYPDEKSWNKSIYNENIKLKSGEYLKRFIELENIFIINSNPSDAKVYIGDSLIGTTPVFYFTKLSELLVRVEKENYETTMIRLKNTNNYHEIMLFKKEIKGNSKPNLKVSFLPAEVYVAGGSAIIFGSSAALLKVKADEHYKKYRNTGDKNELAQVRKFDKLSGISLFLCEISNILLVYLLLLR